MAVSLASPTPILTPSSTKTNIFQVRFSNSFVSKHYLQKRRNLLKTPLQVSTTTPSAPIAEEDQEKRDPFIQTEDSEDASSTKFSWRDHWYPVSLLEDLDPRYPTPFQLLNRDLVLWFDKSASQWVAFDDKCPHRLAPLSVILSIFIFLKHFSTYNCLYV